MTLVTVTPELRVNMEFVASIEIDHRHYVNGNRSFLVVTMKDGRQHRIEHGIGGVDIYKIQADMISQPEPREEQAVTIDYTNHRGERARRRVVPQRIAFESSEWHREPQWLMHAYDINRGVTRAFALSQIHEWVRK